MATSLIDKFMEKYCSDGRAYVGSLSAQSDLLVVKLSVPFWETKLCIFPCCWLWSLIECNIEIGVGLCGCGFAYFFVWKSASEPQNHATKKKKCWLKEDLGQLPACNGNMVNIGLGQTCLLLVFGGCNFPWICLSALTFKESKNKWVMRKGDVEFRFAFEWIFSDLFHIIPLGHEKNRHRLLSSL